MEASGTQSGEVKITVLNKGKSSITQKIQEIQYKTLGEIRERRRITDKSPLTLSWPVKWNIKNPQAGYIIQWVKRHEYTRVKRHDYTGKEKLKQEKCEFFERWKVTQKGEAWQILPNSNDTHDIWNLPLNDGDDPIQCLWRSRVYFVSELPNSIKWYTPSIEEAIQNNCPAGTLPQVVKSNNEKDYNFLVEFVETLPIQMRREARITWIKTNDSNDETQPWYYKLSCSVTSKSDFEDKYFHEYNQKSQSRGCTIL